MVQQLLTVFAPMLLGAQLILTLILVKGDICPGQRGRIHKLLPSIGVLWLAVASLKIEAFMVVFAIFYFYSQVQTGKTREKGPMWVMYLADGLALSYVAILMGEQNSVVAGANVFVQTILLGAIFSHLLLKIARSRLQAFHRLLPSIGVISGILMSLCVLFKVYGLTPELAEQALQGIVLSFVLLIVGIVVWCWHLFTHKEVAKGQLVLALLTLLASTALSQSLFAL